MTQEAPQEAPVTTEPVTGGSLIEQDAIDKLNAGACLTFAVWSLPSAVAQQLHRDAPPAFVNAWRAAQAAYGIGES